MKNNRRNFLKTAGVVGLGALAVPVKAIGGGDSSETLGSCVLIPSETAGPFPLDLTENATFFRSDIREDRTGVRLNLTLRIVGLDNCNPMANVRVNIWHCDKDGLYSGYDTANNAGQEGLTYLRGYQIADANGEVNFTTIFPGWYTGRICHIHFQVYVSTTYAAISQLTFPIEPKQQIYNDNPDAYTKGEDPLGFASDSIFADGYTYQLSSLTENADGSYDAFLEVTVEGSGTTGIGLAEHLNAQQFTLAQNQPNPFTGATYIPLYLKFPSDVQITLFDIQGNVVKTIDHANLLSGDHQLLIDLEALGIPTANYVYQVAVTNTNGRFVDSKFMTKSAE